MQSADLVSFSLNVLYRHCAIKNEMSSRDMGFCPYFVICTFGGTDKWIDRKEEDWSDRQTLPK